MKWLSFRQNDGVHAGVLIGETIADLGTRPLQAWFTDLAAAEAEIVSAARLQLKDVVLCQPILRPGKILGIGLNYHDHARETGRDPPAVQTWFVKQSTAAHPPFGTVDLPAVSDKLDYEAELVVVIGRYGRHVPASRAMEIVAGFTCGCDYSVRDWQRATPTMNMGKGFDTHAPFGPWIVSPDELGEIDELGVRCLVNGELRQSGRAGDMVHKIRDQIAHLTAAFTLEPGDVLYTGTPAGVGVAHTPPKFLKVGDRVWVEIDRIGYMEHEIVAESGQMRIDD